MVKIRLARYGNKKRPFYKIVVADSRFSRDGRFIEQLGYFNPLSKDTATSLKININRIIYWKKNGAHLSDRSKKLIQLFEKNKEKL
ncbi:30S ribosomal protein S16 [Buchnera aphidicola]|uniref:Small ribosomal subunit protein bS16 n=1 Tax=Buchnera aphidicola (Aphis gossypii) TaxID=98785 RepID=A0A5J6ZA08_9GAMM|nr:30S ribosomal protein S16 [Buchnera aphidicola]QFQ32214.1 30S ribosomal protein S16 [Buchnera aphidicola (Aphis gossypii)]UPT14740.1 30S ribosomal protein S16 [Buchnera aphidicola (Aphis gossypii)]